MTQFPFLPSGESRELANDVEELLDELAQTLPRERRAYSGECRPTLDVLETDSAVEVTVDLAGVALDAIRVLVRGTTLVIAGEKAPAAASPDQAFHLVERDFGRFARVVHLSGAFDVPQAQATLRDGELTVVLPRRIDRRHQAHRVAVR